MPAIVVLAGQGDFRLNMIGMFGVSLIAVTIERPSVGEVPPATAMILAMIKRTIHNILPGLIVRF